MRGKRVRFVVLAAVASAATACTAGSSDPPPAHTTANVLTPAPAPSSNSEPDTTLRALPGLTSADVKVNLEKAIGMTFSGPKEGSLGNGVSIDTGHATDTATGAAFTTTLQGDLPSRVAIVNCAVTGGNQTVETAFVAFCATTPYDGAGPADAKAWVQTTVPTLHAKAVSETFGPATFTLSGTPGVAITLQIARS